MEQDDHVVVHCSRAMEAVMVREWVEAAGFVMVVAACYMMVVPI
ncbi:hypothetical protein [Pseudorhizobium endolithicum]|nr:hypothetical protein [Pseudorhizobium endolithicum]